jgi:hypothetical protein
MSETFYTVKYPVPEKELMLDVVYIGTIPAKVQTCINRSLKWLTQYTGLNFKVRNWCRQAKPLKTWPNGKAIYISTDGIDWTGLGIREAAPFTLVLWKTDLSRTQAGGGHVGNFWTALPVHVINTNADYFTNPYYAWKTTLDYGLCHELLHTISFWHEGLTGVSLNGDSLDDANRPQNHLDFCANIKNSPAIRATLEKLTAPHGYGA